MLAGQRRTRDIQERRRPFDDECPQMCNDVRKVWGRLCTTMLTAGNELLCSLPVTDYLAL